MIIMIIVGDYLNHLWMTYLFSLLTTIDGVSSLKLVELSVPAQVPLGTRAQLECRWQLGPADVLYSVKWYKDGKEFFRHVPREAESKRKFPLPGVSVEESDSSGSRIVLSEATPDTSGRYRCEVSGERPLFHTVSGHADMDIILLPSHGPIVSGLRPRYRVGDRLRLNCTSGWSRPATCLTWYINGEPATAEAISIPVYQEYGDTKTTTVLLDLKVTEGYELKVKCLATMGTMYWRSNEKKAIVEQRQVYNASKRIEQETYIWADQELRNHAQVPTMSSFTNLLIFALITVF